MVFFSNILTPCFLLNRSAMAAAISLCPVSAKAHSSCYSSLASSFVFSKSLVGGFQKAQKLSSFQLPRLRVSSAAVNENVVTVSDSSRPAIRLA